MATEAQKKALTALYAGYFDRAPDPAGLQFWINQIDNGRAFNTIAADFAASAEATALYPYLTAPDVATSSTFITSVYQNLFNRAPDAEGLAFWKGVLEAKSVSVADMIEAIINGAKDAPTATPATFDKATLDNKVEAGLDFAVDAGNTSGFTYDADAKVAATAAIAGVTNDPATVTAAKAATDAYLTGSATVGQTLTLTTGVDSLIGSASNDTFTGVVSAVAANSTLNLGDNIKGGAGVDTLKIINGNAAAIPSFTTTDVENYDIQNTAASSLAVSSLSTAPTSVSFIGGGNNTFTLSGMGTGTAIDLEKDAGQITLNYSSVTGASDAATIGLNAAAATSSIDADGIETFNVTTSGAKSTLAALTGNAGKKLVVAGDQALTITTDLANTFTTIDASASTGATKLGVAAGGNVTYTGGAADDRIDMNGGLTTADTLAGGAGVDTLAVSGAVSTADVSKVTAFEKLEFTGAVTQDLGLVSATGIKTFISSNGAANSTFTNAKDDMSFVASEKTAGTVSVAAAVNGPSDVLNLELSNSDLTALTASNYETINLKSTTGLATAGTATNVVTTLTNSANAKIVATGDTNLTITNALAANATVDASALTGKLSVVGSAGSDVIKGGTAADTIDGGSITTTAQTSTVTLAQGAGVAGYEAADSLSLTVGGTTFTDTGNARADLDAGGTALAALIDADAAYNASYAAGTDTITITAANPATSFTVSGPTFVDDTTANDNGTITGTTATTAAVQSVDVLTGNAGADVFSFQNVDVDTAVAAGQVTAEITDFVSGVDTIKTSSAVAGSATTYKEATSAAASLNALLTAADTALDGTVDYYVGQVGADSYVVTDLDGTGFTNVIKLTGVGLDGVAATDFVA